VIAARNPFNREKASHWLNMASFLQAAHDRRMATYMFTPQAVRPHIC